MSRSLSQTLFPEDVVVDRRPGSPPSSGGAEEVEAAPLPTVRDRLERMGARGRLEAFRAGRLSRRERTVWASSHPEEVPTVNGEFEWIALGSADLD